MSLLGRLWLGLKQTLAGTDGCPCPACGQNEQGAQE